MSHSIGVEEKSVEISVERASPGMQGVRRHFRLIEGTLSTERELHKRFAEHLHCGEWFERHEDILAHFREHGVAL